jgi:hypothetical protein
MARTTIAMILGLVLVLAGCEDTTQPERREVLGSWVSTELPGVTIRMTLAETARSVDGAGSWIDGENAFAFRVAGALARDEVSLHLDFAERESLNFQGFFVHGDRIEGVLTGGQFRGAPLGFERERLPFR